MVKFLNAVGKNLKYWRKNKGLTQEKLAEKLHVSRSIISNYENGKQELNASIIINICKILEIDANLLLGIEETNGKNIIYSLSRYIANEENSIEKIENLKICINRILDCFILK